MKVLVWQGEGCIALVRMVEALNKERVLRGEEPFEIEGVGPDIKRAEIAGLWGTFPVLVHVTSLDDEPDSGDYLDCVDNYRSNDAGRVYRGMAILVVESLMQVLPEV